MQNKRLYDLDWLRIIAFIILIVFHVGMLFSHWDWHVKSEARSPVLDAVMVFSHVWRLPLLLFIAGAATFFALRRRSARQYLGERGRRLLIPLVFGMAVIVPPQVYMEFMAKHESFWAFYPTVFELVPYPEGSLSWNHLWFVLYLFCFSALALPIFLYLRHERSAALRRAVAALASRRGGFLWLLAPLFVIHLALMPLFPRNTLALVNDWGYFGHYFFFFVAGYVCASNPRILALLEERRRAHLATAAVLMIPFYAATYLPVPFAIGEYRVLYWLPAATMTWFLILTIVGYGRRYLDRPSRVLSYANEAVYPFYILHQTIIVVAGYFFVQRWPTSVYGNLVAISVFTFASCWLLHHFIIRRLWVTRLLFGLKPKARQTSHTVKASAAMAGAAREWPQAGSPAVSAAQSPSS